MNPTYPMGRGAPLDHTRIGALRDGKLDTDDVVLLMQDVIEAGEVHNHGIDVFLLARHCVENGLCTINGRFLQ